MSTQYPGGFITKSPVTPTTTSAKGMWTLSEQAGYRKQSLWPTSPGAPTIGTATATSSTAASVTFTAPANTGSAAITSYTVTSSPSGLTGTGASSPITVSGLTPGTAYTFTVVATNGAGSSPASASSNSVTPVAQGQQAFTTAGTFSWVAPAGVASVSVVAVGGGAGGGGGLGYKNNISVTPGNSYTVIVGARAPVSGTSMGDGGTSSFINTCTVRGNGSLNRSGGTYLGDGGGNGGSGNAGGGGGAGGYSGNGGAGGTLGSSATSGAAGTGGAGGGGGGGVGYFGSGIFLYGSGGGGGVGILGQGSNGSGGSSGSPGSGGGAGSGGAAGTAGSGSTGGNGGAYGGGGAWFGATWSGCCVIDGTNGTPAAGAVRIIWPGTTRSFPSTNTGNL